MIIDFFNSYLKKKEYKYLIHDDNRFIHPLPARKECKYLIHNDNEFIYPLPQKKGV